MAQVDAGKIGENAGRAIRIVRLNSVRLHSRKYDAIKKGGERAARDFYRALSRSGVKVRPPDPDT